MPYARGSETADQVPGVFNSTLLDDIQSRTSSSDPCLHEGRSPGKTLLVMRVQVSFFQLPPSTDAKLSLPLAH
jgi:hypothetical protein